MAQEQKTSYNGGDHKSQDERAVKEKLEESLRNWTSLHDRCGDEADAIIEESWLLIPPVAGGRHLYTRSG